MRRHIFRQRIDIVMVQPQQFIGAERAADLLTAAIEGEQLLPSLRG